MKVLFTDKKLYYGNPLRPSYANIFKAEFKEKLIYPLIKNKCAIDNMFMVWIKSEKQLRQSIRQIHVLFLSYKYCNKWITTLNNDNVQSRDQEESKLKDTINMNSGAHTLTPGKIIKKSIK